LTTRYGEIRDIAQRAERCPRNRQHFRPWIARTMPHLRQCGAIVAARYTSIHLWGQEGCNAHATYFGNRDSWGWYVRGSAIDPCAAVRCRSLSLPHKGATRGRCAGSGRAVGAAAKESEPRRAPKCCAPKREGASKTRGATRRRPREAEQTGGAGALGRFHRAEGGRGSSRASAVAACGSTSQCRKPGRKSGGGCGGGLAGSANDRGRRRQRSRSRASGDERGCDGSRQDDRGDDGGDKCGESGRPERGQ